MNCREQVSKTFSPLLGCLMGCFIDSSNVEVRHGLDTSRFVGHGEPPALNSSMNIYALFKHLALMRLLQYYDVARENNHMALIFSMLN